MSVFGAKQLVRSKPDSQEKAEIALVRLRGACARCSRLKKKVYCSNKFNLVRCLIMYQCRFGPSVFEPCINCLQAKPSVLKMPCILKATILDIFLFRPGIAPECICPAIGILTLNTGPPLDVPNHPLNFSKHRKDVLALSAAEIQHSVQLRTIELTQDMGHVLEVTVAPFVPVPYDKTAYEWSTKDGSQRMEMPPYLIENIQDAKKSILIYAQKARLAYLENLLDNSNSILWNTFNTALQSKVAVLPLKPTPYNELTVLVPDRQR